MYKKYSRTQAMYKKYSRTHARTVHKQCTKNIHVHTHVHKQCTKNIHVHTHVHKQCTKNIHVHTHVQKQCIKNIHIHTHVHKQCTKVKKYFCNLQHCHLLYAELGMRPILYTVRKAIQISAI